jgi:hypothetical protein
MITSLFLLEILIGFILFIDGSKISNPQGMSKANFDIFLSFKIYQSIAIKSPV